MVEYPEQPPSRAEQLKSHLLLGTTFGAYHMPWLVYGEGHRRVGTRVIKDFPITVNGKELVGHQVVEG